ncbi:MAG: hypothetical protein A3E87_07460 [Gammaproteobacteria bacterium RIFCSPHIGHO2_12_FULL_35_23]|nr:MAG: hypothetical protein A3E87_07460 [Gammaproteobacteria bacterium RIFCSPHIGHO2_12_FULL_35_23]
MRQNKEEKYLIKVTVLFEKSFWIGVFERNDNNYYAIARHIFGTEPTDPELYQFVRNHYSELNFSQPIEGFKLIIKRKKFKRTVREAKKEIKKVVVLKKESYAQEALRVELEKSKKQRKTQSKQNKVAQEEAKFLQKQMKKKKKQRGH